MNYKPISKITIYSTIMLVFAIIGIVIFSTDFPNWKLYGWNDLVDPVSFEGPHVKMLPVSVQAARAWSAASLIICSLMIGFNSMEIKRMEKSNYKKYFVSSIGIFTWLLLPYTIYIGVKNKLYEDYFSYISQNRVGTRQMSLSAFKNGFQKNGKRNMLFWNTTFGYFILLITFIGFIFGFLIFTELWPDKIVIPELKPGFSDEQYKAYMENYYIFDTFSYFTQLSNMACFVFMIFFTAFNNKIAFRNNTILIAISSYIFIVSVIFWVYLFPTSLDHYTWAFQWAKTSWTHAVAPILFIAFAITSLVINKNAPQKFKKMIGVSMIFPLSYGVFTYSLPFYTRFSVYGSLTNINPNMNTSIGVNEATKNGSLAMIGAIFLLGGIFVLVIFLFWLIAYKINKKENNKMGLV